MEENIMKQKKEPIETYILEITNKCNEACNFCYSVSYDPTTRSGRIPRQLDGREWMNGLENIAKNGAKAVDFSGGEPTLHPDFPEIAKKASDSGLYVILSSNGSTINNERIRQSIDSYVDCVSLSIHGVGDVHEAIKKRKGSYEKVMRAYEHFTRGKPKVKVNTVACRANLERISEIGYTLNIENNPVQWKISQVIPREAGLTNKHDVSITNEKYKQITESVQAQYPRAFSEGRITFREDDSTDAHQFVPYLIADSSGQLQIPVGEKHKPLKISILEKDLTTQLGEKIEELKNFPDALNKNHEKFYGNPTKEKRSLPIFQDANVRGRDEVNYTECMYCPSDKILTPISNCSYVCQDCKNVNEFCGE